MSMPRVIIRCVPYLAGRELTRPGRPRGLRRNGSATIAPGRSTLGAGWVSLSSITTAHTETRRHGEVGVEALSVRQPWAGLVVDGIKDVENRNKATSFRGRIGVHASLKPDLGPEVLRLRQSRHQTHYGAVRVSRPQPSPLPELSPTRPRAG